MDSPPFSRNSHGRGDDTPTGRRSRIVEGNATEEERDDDDDGEPPTLRFEALGAREKGKRKGKGMRNIEEKNEKKRSQGGRTHAVREGP